MTKKDSPDINMVIQTLLVLMTFSLISINSWAEEIQINPAHPDQYTVVKGDTLWDISGKFLNQPWQWPELWSHNSQIKNPQLIYPGDTIYFLIANGRPQLGLSKNEQPAQYPGDSSCVLSENDVKNGRTKFAVSETGKLLPCIRETAIKKAINLIPTESIAQFLTSPKVVTENELSNAPYVIDFAGEHLIAGAGDKVYVRSIAQSENLSYTIYRAGEAYISPDTGEVLGYDAKYIADTTLQQSGDPSTLLITKSNSEVRKGDRTMPKNEDEVILNYFPRPPEKSINGSVISVLGGVSQIGLYNIVVIDKGTKDGILAGHDLAIYRKGKSINDPYSAVKNDVVKLPDEIAGTLMVFRPFERVSYALVMKATQAIHILDKVKTP
jgi:hypothetical protein